MVRFKLTHYSIIVHAMNQKVVGVIAVIVVLIGGWYLLSGTPAEEVVTPGDQTPTGSGTTTEDIVAEDTEDSVTVRYTDTGFSPGSVTIPVGGTVTFVNESSGKMWIASAMHPDHTAYSGTSLSQHCPDTAGTAFDQCAAGEQGTTYSFTFDKGGTWRYHDHLNATRFGSVIVTGTP